MKCTRSGGTREGTSLATALPGRKRAPPAILVPHKCPCALQALRHLMLGMEHWALEPRRGENKVTRAEGCVMCHLCLIVPDPVADTHGALRPESQHPSLLSMVLGTVGDRGDRTLDGHQSPRSARGTGGGGQAMGRATEPKSRGTLGHASADIWASICVKSPVGSGRMGLREETGMPQMWGYRGAPPQLSPPQVGRLLGHPALEQGDLVQVHERDIADGVGQALVQQREDDHIQCRPLSLETE